MSGRRENSGWSSLGFWRGVLGGGGGPERSRSEPGAAGCQRGPARKPPLGKEPGDRIEAIGVHPHLRSRGRVQHVTRPAPHDPVWFACRSSRRADKPGDRGELRLTTCLQYRQPSGRDRPAAHFTDECPEPLHQGASRAPAARSLVGVDGSAASSGSPTAHRTSGRRGCARPRSPTAPPGFEGLGPLAVAR